ASARRATEWITLRRELNGELEWIPLKAMRKDRAERYRSPSELADDVRNYLDGRPLIAGPQSKAYVARKFIQKHWAGVSFATAVAVVIVGLLVALSITAQRALKAEKDQVAEKNKATIAAQRADVARHEAEQTLSERLVGFGDRLMSLNKPTEARESFLQAWDAARDLKIDEVPVLSRVLATGPRDVPLMGSYKSVGGVGGFHEDGHVNCLALFRDGKTAVTCDDKADLKFWDLTTGLLLGTIPTGQSRGVSYVAISPDEKTILSAGFDSTVNVWNVADRSLLRTFSDHHSDVYCVIFSPDGQTAVSGDTQGYIKHWNIDTASLIKGWKANDEGAVAALAFSRDGQTLISGGHDGSVKAWNFGSNDPPRIVGRIIGENRNVNSVALSPDERIVVSGSFNGTVELWDLSGEQPGRVLATTNWVWRVAFSP
ncbi:MAG TPA: hypothetical protein VK137_09055, partial [Planctomycetaceae bacterium]|nr:hypothetical protein [Planctomycetaceae bacterium]